MEKILQRILDHFFKEKLDVFGKWSVGGSLAMWIFLFNTQTGSQNFWYVYIVKVFSICVTAFISGVFGVLGNDAVNWIKATIKTIKTKRNERRQRNTERDNKAA